jgi:hypothetical protein
VFITFFYPVTAGRGRHGVKSAGGEGDCVKEGGGEEGERERERAREVRLHFSLGY